MNAKYVIKVAASLLEDPKWGRRLKTIAVVGVLGLFLSGGLVIWAGFSAAKFVIGEMGPVVATGARVIEKPESSIAQVETLKNESSKEDLI